MSRKRCRSSDFYYKIKKQRYLKSLESSSEWEDTSNSNHSITNMTNSSSGSFHVETINNPANNKILHDEPHEEPVLDESLYSRIIKWIINNIDKLHMTTVDELLEILIKEGYKMFPPKAHVLLGYKHSINSQPVLTKNNNLGQYLNLGILNGLEKRIDLEIFKEECIKIVVFIDGMKIYRVSQKSRTPL
ncbi:hypothetical protein KQX54_010340 [Cotesia glomerata]|uniref:Uncharacterized protein n=1 Tax=Cotesia glomerata TaxID=32391 RepID=A0AAV7HIJ2_COTGL|nr:hypothetical protein KQX54_010340 [Cotesia glomerata]